MYSDDTIIDVSKKSSKPLWIGGGLIIGVFVAIGVVFLYWPVSTGISLEVEVNHAEWTVGIFPSQQILNPILVQSLSFQNFSSVAFQPSSLLVSDAAGYDRRPEQFSPDVWDAITIFGDVRFTPKNEETLIQIQAQDRAEAILGTLSSLHIREESNVTLEVDKHDPRLVTVKILGPESIVYFSPIQPFEIIADEANLAGLKEFPLIHKSSLVFRPELPEHRSQIEIKGTKQQLVITLMVSPSPHPTVFSEQAFPIKAIEFSRQGDSGQTLSTLVGPGKLEYTDFSHISAKTIAATDFVQIEPLKILMIKRITLLSNRPGFMFSLDGMAKSIQTGSHGSFIDHRVSFSDRLWNDGPHQ